MPLPVRRVDNDGDGVTGDDDNDESDNDGATGNDDNDDQDSATNDKIDNDDGNGTIDDDIGDGCNGMTGNNDNDSNNATDNDVDDDGNGATDNYVDDDDGNRRMDGNRTTDDDVNNDGYGTREDNIDTDCNGEMDGRHCLDNGGCATKGDARWRHATTGNATTSRQTRCKREERCQWTRSDRALIGQGCALRGGGRVKKVRDGGIGLPSRNGSP